VTWLTIKILTKKSLLWIRKYWQIPFLAVWTLITFLIFRRNTAAAFEVLEAKRKSYNKEINELKIRHKSEIMERDKLIEEYHKTIKKIEEKFKERDKKLSRKEKQKVKQIVKKSKGKPDVIRREIEESFGFTYID